MRKAVSFMLAIFMVMGLSACGPQAAPGSGDTGSTRVFVDDCGRQVEIPAEITRIVPAGPLAEMILFAIAPDMLVGLTGPWGEECRGIIEEQYFDLPCFGQLYGSADLNVEELALAGPQLIIDVGEAKGSVAEDLDTLQAQTTIPAVHISATLETMPQTFRTLGVLLGREEKGEALAQFCERVYGRTISVMEQVGGNKVRTLYVLGEAGLNVIARGSYHAEVLDLLCDNAAVVDNPMSKGTGNEVTMEQIALWNPEFVIFAPDSIYAAVGELDAWSEVDAVERGHFVQVPDVPHNWMGNPPAVQRYLALIWLTAQLYPGYCDYDVKAEIMEYYELFYGCRLTDQQYEMLTAHAFVH